MKSQGHLLPILDSKLEKSENYQTWDLMYIVQSLSDHKATRTKRYSFAHSRGHA